MRASAYIRRQGGEKRFADDGYDRKQVASNRLAT
jgi:hypothetical protein